MCSWANFYRRPANEARERAARVSNGSIKDKFEAVAKEWSALAVWAELKRSSPSTATEVDTREANRTLGHPRAAKPSKEKGRQGEHLIARRPLPGLG
jgi:hypothetical protein